MICKKHFLADGRMILVVVDDELVGKRFEEGDLQIDLSKDFYKGEEVSEAEVVGLFRKAYIIHLVGEKAVELGIKEGYVDRNRVVKIAGVKHAEVLC
ncbi:DUF424 domain-containing protein [Candidatus Woesearchaeota archaeon]|nr:MAG: DUF424 domain-containing protein [Candidatus Woesearchaeota archaeon]